MKKTLLLLMLLLGCTSVFATRRQILLNDDWQFRFSYHVQRGSAERVDLPHTWNAQDALSGKQDYYRGMGNYEKTLFVSSDWQGKRLYLRFEGVSTVTELFINDVYVGGHRGAYGAFVFDITDFVAYGKENKILVKVTNALQLDIMPLVGDFNIYGGIYRDVNLIITELTHISLTDYASPGVYLIQNEVSKEKAAITAKVVLSNHTGKPANAELQVKIWDGGKLIQQKTEPVTLPAAAENIITTALTLQKPRLWNGVKDPFMYKAEVTLVADGKELDKVTQPLGLRFYHVDANEGFFLNGEHVKLKGVCRHQDRAEVGSALRLQHHQEDAQIMLEMGANAVRLAHYPQATAFYDLMDQHGLVVWAEIPFIGPGGYLDRGFNDIPAFRENGKEQLKELIRQHYNHPSICFWGLYNELKTYGDNPIEYVKELDALAKQEDPTRPTTAASFLSHHDKLNATTDLVAWNQYFGWYGGSPADMGPWADAVHRDYPEFKMGVSEYGAGASIYHQQDSVKPGDASGWWHPENFQTYFHIYNWKAIAERPFIWGSYIWNLFDFGAAHRTEGDRPGINDKGLVTFDRKVKKDAFYFYKANWNQKDKFVYISNRRHINRSQPVTDITVFSNLPKAELFVNGVSKGIRNAGEYAIFTWEGISLEKGENEIVVKGVKPQQAYEDKVVWTYQY